MPFANEIFNRFSIKIFYIILNSQESYKQTSGAEYFFVDIESPRDLEPGLREPTNHHILSIIDDIIMVEIAPNNIISLQMSNGPG